VVMKISIPWDIMPCSLLKVNWRFIGTWRIHLQGWKISQAKNKHEAGSKESIVSCQVLFFKPQLWNFGLTLKGLHGAVNQKTELFSLIHLQYSQPTSLTFTFLQINLSWDVILCSMAECYKSLGGAFCIYL
jgi:hypothetical protein